MRKLKLLHLPLLFAVFIAASSSPSGAQAEPLTEGLLLLNQGKTQEAADLLETDFDAEKSNDSKVELAGILALLPKEVKTRKAKYLYAWFELDQNSHISPKDKARYYRIASDGYFDAAKMDRAQEYYQAWIKDSGSSAEDREYATYKLGWVYLNLGKPEACFELFSSWTDTHADGDLRESMMREKWRAWTEALLLGRMKTVLTNSSVKPENRSVMIDGVISALRRESDTPHAKLKNAIPTILRTDFLTALLKEDRLFHSKPCDILIWTGPNDPLPSNQEGIEKMVYACAALAAKKSGIQKDLAIQLSSVLERFKVNPKFQQEHAEIVFASDNKTLSCLEYSKLAAGGTSGLLSRIEASCTRPNPELSRWVTSLFENLNNSQNNDATKAFLVRSFSHPALAEVSWNALLKNKLVWMNQELPLLIIEQFNKNPNKQLELLNAFTPQPLTPQYESYWLSWIEKRVQQKDLASAQDRLTQRFPLDHPLPPIALRLWVKLNQGRTPIPGTVELIAARWHENRSVMDESDSKNFLSLLSDSTRDMQGLSLAIWSHWDLVGEVVLSKHKLRSSLLTQTIAGGKTLAPILKTFSADSTASYALKLITLADDDQLLRITAPEGFRRSEIQSDADALSEFKNESIGFANLRFVDGPKLDHLIGKKMSALKRQIKEVSRRKWVVGSYANSAERILRNNTKSLADAIEGARTENQETRDQLKQLSDVIRGWVSGDQAS